MSKLIRTLHPEIRVVSAKDHTVDYVASDESVDCYREVVRAKGWRFTNFEKNAPFVDSHDYSCIDRLLGKVTDFRVAGGQLVERVQWAAGINPLADLGWKLTEGGYLKAVSVGFIPTKSASKWDAAKGDFARELAELKLPAEEAAKLNTIFLEQEQIELSACIIGANPNALAKAHTDGAVRDEDLAACGFASDDDLAFLHDAAEAFESASPAQRILLKRELARIPFRKTTRQHTATPPIGLDAGGEATRREQAEFLRKLKALTTH